MDYDINVEQDARTWRSMRLGEELLIPDDVRQQDPQTVIRAALDRLQDLRRRRGAFGKLHSGHYNTER